MHGQALPVRRSGKPVEEGWDRPPVTANEYLARVRHEASAIPDVMTAPTYPEAAAITPSVGVGKGVGVGRRSLAKWLVCSGWKQRTCPQPCSPWPTIP